MLAPADLTDKFRARGLKVTPQRQLLFKLLHDNADHPTVDALFAAASTMMPGISLRTVYQTLNDLAAMGELQVLQSGSGAARFDPNISEHHHALCDRCGDVHDVYVADVDQLQVRNLDGFAADRARIVFGGLCAACQSTLSRKSQRKKTDNH